MAPSLEPRHDGLPQKISPPYQGRVSEMPPFHASGDHPLMPSTPSVSAASNGYGAHPTPSHPLTSEGSVSSAISSASSSRAKLQALHARCASLEAENNALRSQRDAKQVELAQATKGHWAAAREETAKLQESSLVAGLRASVEDTNNKNSKLRMKIEELMAENLRLNRLTDKALQQRDEQMARADEGLKGKEEAEAAARRANARAEKALADKIASELAASEADNLVARALGAKAAAELAADKSLSQASDALAAQQASVRAAGEAQARAEEALSLQRTAEKAAAAAELRAAQAADRREAAEQRAETAEAQAAEALSSQAAAEAAKAAAENKATKAVRSGEAALAAAQRAAQSQVDEALRDREAARQESQQAHAQAAQAQRQKEIAQKAAEDALPRLLSIVLKVRGLSSYRSADISQTADSISWEVHEAAWTLFDKRTSSVKLTRKDIPWPPCPPKQNVLSAAVRAAKLSASIPDCSESLKSMHTKLLKRWHPDKFFGKFAVSDDPAEQQHIKDKLNAILQSLMNGYSDMS